MNYSTKILVKDLIIIEIVLPTRGITISISTKDMKNNLLLNGTT